VEGSQGPERVTAAEGLKRVGVTAGEGLQRVVGEEEMEAEAVDHLEEVPNLHKRARQLL